MCHTGTKSFWFYRAVFTLESLEAYESEVDQILKDANAKVRRLAEAHAATFQLNLADAFSGLLDPFRIYPLVN